MQNLQCTKGASLFYIYELIKIMVLSKTKYLSCANFPTFLLNGDSLRMTLPKIQVSTCINMFNPTQLTNNYRKIGCSLVNCLASRIFRGLGCFQFKNYLEKFITCKSALWVIRWPIIEKKNWLFLKGFPYASLTWA